jgi:hypothetical protein
MNRQSLKLGCWLLLGGLFLGVPALSLAQPANVYPVKGLFATRMDLIPKDAVDQVFELKFNAIEGELKPFGMVTAQLPMVLVRLYLPRGEVVILTKTGFGTISMKDTGDQILGRYVFPYDTVKIGADGSITFEIELMVLDGTYRFEKALGSAKAYIRGDIRSWNMVVDLTGEIKLADGAGAYNVSFGKWTRDAERDRYACEFTYPDRTNPKTINTQLLMWYPNDPERKGYYYLANSKGEIWGRCHSPAHSSYDAKNLRWWKYTGQNWTEQAATEPFRAVDAHDRATIKVLPGLPPL